VTDVVIGIDPGRPGGDLSAVVIGRLAEAGINVTTINMAEPGVERTASGMQMLQEAMRAHVDAMAQPYQRAMLNTMIRGFGLIAGLKARAEPTAFDRWFKVSRRLHRVTGATPRSASARGRKRAKHQAGMRSSKTIKFRRPTPYRPISVPPTDPGRDMGDALKYALHISPIPLMPGMDPGSRKSFYRPAPGAPKFDTREEAVAWLEANQ
jgi:hypothetical protein